MARYEHIDGSTQRFWEIEVDGRFVITRWGRLGRQPQSRTVACGDEAEAQRRRDTLVRQKLGSGYARVGHEIAAERTGAGNPALEAAIVADPDDLGSRLVYADWLMAQDATLGELIALEIRHVRTDDERLLSRIAQLRAQCAGEVGDRRTLQLHWRLGLIRKARLSVWQGSTVLEQLLALPAARTLEVLRLDVSADTGTPADRGAMLRSLAERSPPHLAQLEIVLRGPEEGEPFTEVDDWWGGLDSLERLLVSTPRAALPLPNERLRVFGFDAAELPWHRSVFESWPRLEHLVLDRVSPRHATRLLTSMVAPGLRSVAVHHTDIESIPWRHVLQSPLAATLRSIELVGPVPWSLYTAMDRLGGRVKVRWCGGRAPVSDYRPEPAPWLEVVQFPRHSVPW